MKARKFEKKASQLYASRIIITMPKSAVFILGAALAVSSYWTAVILVNAIGLVLGIMALATVVASRRQVAKLRDEVSFANRNVDEDIDEPITQSVLKDFPVNGKVNDSDYTRIPRSR
jgi:hypothetical protein